MDQEKIKAKNKLLTIMLFFLIIIIILLILLMTFTKNSPITHNSMKILSTTKIEHSEDSLIVAVENNSSTNYLSVEPFIIIYDDNNVPIATSTSTVIELFKAGDTKYITFYNIPKEYNRLELGLQQYDEGLDQDFEYYNKILNNVSYSFTKKTDEDGTQFEQVTGTNNSNVEIEACFQIKYYSGNELIYIDDYWTTIDSNSDFTDKIYLTTEYTDETQFPKDFTYKIELVDISPVVMSYEDDDYNSYYEDIDNDDSYINVDTETSPEAENETKVETTTTTIENNN